MLDGVLEIPGALHAVLVSADGLLMTSSKELDKDNAERAAAGMSGVQSLSRSLAFFCDQPGLKWQQTVVEFDGGWIFLISAGSGAYLAVSATTDVDMESITYRMQLIVSQLGKELATSPREGTGARP
ncbi:roadblock/LC7 domain-containing protein [Streptomyces sodiiphilus]|uniref:Roadblock/LC7 domain-containing protein n=2 Tax=Streptomyces sodiiphilus TaxID=226217 RepID=A0ABN2PMZ5_9ACTN